MASQRTYWDQLAKHGAHAVLDPNDSRGFKNDYIHAMRSVPVLEHANQQHGLIALDLGCGSGMLTQLIRTVSVSAIGADISMDMLTLARSNTSAPLVQISGVELPFRDDSIGSVLTYGVLVYLTHDHDLRRLLGAVSRVVKPGGRVLLIEQTARRRRVSRDGQKRIRSVDAYVDAIESAGMQIKTIKTIRGGHFPILYLIRVGLVPRRWWRQVSRWDGWYARSPLSVFDYRDTAFECIVVSGLGDYSTTS